MKKMKMIALVALSLCMILALAACTPAAPAPEPVEAPAETEDNVVGIVGEGGSMHDMYVTDSTGATYLFGIGDDTVVDSGAADIGTEVKVHFEGTLDPSATGMQTVTVERIELMRAAHEVAAAPAPAPAAAPKPAPAPAPAPAPKPAPEPSQPLTGPDSGLPAGASKEMVATVDQINGDNTFFASDTTGVDYCFSLSGIVVESSDGTVHVGDTISIYYTGPIEATDKVQSKITISKIVVK